MRLYKFAFAYVESHKSPCSFSGDGYFCRFEDTRSVKLFFLVVAGTYQQGECGDSYYSLFHVSSF